jgi:hypothetical protein
VWYDKEILSLLKKLVSGQAEQTKLLQAIIDRLPPKPDPLLPEVTGIDAGFQETK